MGSEGYFINQFLCLHTNRRTDRWGGDYENRMRLPVEVVRRVRAAVGPDFIIIYRISLLDLVPNGQRWDEIVRLAKAIEAAGATILNTGIGWHEARVPTIATSVPRRAFAWVTRKLMGEVVASPSSPRTGSTRPRWPRRCWPRAAPTWCRWRGRSWPMPISSPRPPRAAPTRSRPASPATRPASTTPSGQDLDLPGQPARRPRDRAELHADRRRKTVAVVGAGPAGLMAALVAAAARPPRDALRARRPARRAAQHGARHPRQGGVSRPGRLVRAHGARAGVELRLGTDGRCRGAGRDFDEVIVATGVSPRDPQIPGQDGPNVLSYIDVLGRRAGGAARGDRRRRRHRLRRGRVPDPRGREPDAEPGGVEARMGRDRPRRRAPAAWPNPRRRRPPARSRFCSARPSGRASGWARPPAGSTARAWPRAG
jgi:2,4-dienoyl-CoA reductase (NADPH2)